MELVRHLVYPPYEGGSLPPWYSDAGYPFTDAGAECLLELQRSLGPVEDVAATWRSSGSAPDIPFDEWTATVKCRNGSGTFTLTGAKPKRFARGGKPAPSPTREDEARIKPFVDRIAKQARDEFAAARAKFTLSDRVPFLVTGASGNVGRATVARLLSQGHRVRVMVRRVPEKPLSNVEYCFGNLGDPAAVDRAVKGAEIVIHIGAATKGGWPEHRVGTVLGTQHVIAACKKYGVKQLVYLSSMSVVDWAGSSDGAPIDESTALEPRPEERGAYTRAKLEAEQLVSAAKLPCVILRPGQIFGPGLPLINGAVARGVRDRWLVLGDGQLELPLVYIDDLLDAIDLAIAKKLVGGEVIQIIDPERITQREVLAAAGGDKPIVAVPRRLVFALGKLTEIPFGVLRRQSPVAAYRLKSALARLHYESDRARSLLGWQPRVGVREGMRRLI